MDKKYDVVDCPPPQGKDVNDYLLLHSCSKSIDKGETNLTIIIMFSLTVFCSARKIWQSKSQKQLHMISIFCCKSKDLHFLKMLRTY